MKGSQRNFRVDERHVRNCATSVHGKVLVSATDTGNVSRSDGGDPPACQS